MLIWPVSKLKAKNAMLKTIPAAIQMQMTMISSQAKRVTWPMSLTLMWAPRIQKLPLRDPAVAAEVTMNQVRSRRRRKRKKVKKDKKEKKSKSEDQAPRKRKPKKEKDDN